MSLTPAPGARLPAVSSLRTEIGLHPHACSGVEPTLNLFLFASTPGTSALQDAGLGSMGDGLRNRPTVGRVDPRSEGDLSPAGLESPRARVVESGHTWRPN